MLIIAFFSLIEDNGNLQYPLNFYINYKKQKMKIIIEGIKKHFKMKN